MQSVPDENRPPAGQQPEVSGCCTRSQPEKRSWGVCAVSLLGSDSYGPCGTLLDGGKHWCRRVVATHTIYRADLQRALHRVQVSPPARPPGRVRRAFAPPAEDRPPAAAAEAGQAGGREGRLRCAQPGGCILEHGEGSHRHARDGNSHTHSFTNDSTTHVALPLCVRVHVSVPLVNAHRR